MRFKYADYLLKVIILFILMSIIHILTMNDSTTGLSKSVTSELQLHEDIIDFENFDNIQGETFRVIPNIVHLLYLNTPTIHFYQMVNIFSIYFNHRPDAIYWHCDNCSFHGKYFEAIRNHKELWIIIKIYKIPFHSTIFGKKYG